jgi:hypothetical protein
VSAPDTRLASEILAQFTDTASAHFDTSLDAMPLDEQQRRELRFWQRQSLAALREYAASALPGALAVLSAAQADVHESLQAAARTWAESGPASAAEPAVAALPDTLEQRRLTVAARLASGA